MNYCLVLPQKYHEQTKKVLFEFPLVKVDLFVTFSHLHILHNRLIMWTLITSFFLAKIQRYLFLGRLRTVKDVGRFRTTKDGAVTGWSRSRNKNAESAVTFSNTLGNVTVITEMVSNANVSKCYSRYFHFVPLPILCLFYRPLGFGRRLRTVPQTLRI